MPGQTGLPLFYIFDSGPYRSDLHCVQLTIDGPFPAVYNFSMIRNCALRLLGFASTSSAVGIIAFRVTHLRLGALGCRNSGTSTSPEKT
jgi:hypothetical protein